MGLSISGLHGWFPGIAAARAAGGDAARGEAIAAWGVFFPCAGNCEEDRLPKTNTEGSSKLGAVWEAGQHSKSKDEYSS